MPGFADRLNGIGISASAAMTDKASALKAEGVKIVSLSSGEPDFPTPNMSWTPRLPQHAQVTPNIRRRMASPR